VADGGDADADDGLCRRRAWLNLGGAPPLLPVTNLLGFGGGCRTKNLSTPGPCCRRSSTAAASADSALRSRPCASEYLTDSGGTASEICRTASANYIGRPRTVDPGSQEMLASLLHRRPEVYSRFGGAAAAAPIMSAATDECRTVPTHAQAQAQAYVHAHAQFEHASAPRDLPESVLLLP
jgi:hypothetical protein